MNFDVSKFSLREDKIIEKYKNGEKIPNKITKRYIDLANDYIERGLSITPVVFKIAYLSNWQKYTEEQVLNRSWYRGANGLGILTGKVNNLICLDMDIEDPKNEVRLELERRLPPIFCAKEGNPLRPPARFFKYNYEESRKFNNIGVEILSDGNQTVLPGSWHDTYDKEYRWIGKSLLEIDIDDLPDIPPDIIPWLIEQNKKAASKKIKKTIDGKTITVNQSLEIKPANNRCYHGSYNNISYLCVSLAKNNYNIEYIKQKAREKDIEINAKADYKFFSCPKRPEFKSLTYEEALDQFVTEIFNKYSPNPLDIRKTMDWKSYEYFKSKIGKGFTYTKIKENGKKETIRDYKALHRFAKTLHHIKYIPEKKSFISWNGKYFEYKSEDFVKQFAQYYFKNPDITNIGERSKFVELIKSSDLASINDYLLTDNESINFHNGIFKINSNKLISHNPDYKMMYIIPHSYIPDSECPTWDELLDNICLSDITKIKAIEEFIGYALSCANYDRFNKILILDGDGSNGKSTLIRIIKNIVGIDNCSAVDPTDIATNRFAAYSMFNKLINFSSEVGKEAFLNTGSLKKITGGDPIMLEAKTKGAFMGNINAKFIISYNKMPYFPDTSEGMRRRLMLIHLNQNFDQNPDLKIANVEKKVMAEAAGVINKCITAYKRVIDKGRFTEPNGGVERIAEIIEASNPIVSFFNERLETGYGGFLSNETLRQEFIDYCEDGGDRAKRIGPYKLINEIIELANKREMHKNNAKNKDEELKLLAEKRLHIYEDEQGVTHEDATLCSTKVVRDSKKVNGKTYRGVSGLYKKSVL